MLHAASRARCSFSIDRFVGNSCSRPCNSTIAYRCNVAGGHAHFMTWCYASLTINHPPVLAPAYQPYLRVNHQRILPGLRRDRCQKLGLQERLLLGALLLSTAILQRIAK